MTRTDEAGNVAMFSSQDAEYTPSDGSTVDTDPAAQSRVAALTAGVAKDKRGAGADQVLPYEPRRPVGSDALRSIADAIGGRVQWFGLRADLLAEQRRQFGWFNGAYQNGTLFLRADGNDRPHLSILGHETAHQFAKDRLDLYAELVEAVRPYVDAQRYGAEFAQSAVARDLKDPAKIREEFVGEILSDGFMDRGFWKAVGDANPTLLQRLGAMVSELIDRIKASTGSSKRTERYLTDYDRVMQIAGEVFGRYGLALPTSRFSRGADTARGLTYDEAEAIVGAVREANPTAPPMIVLESVDQAPKALLKDIEDAGAENDVEAVYHEGKVYVFAPHLKSMERAMFVIAHHELRHHGKRSLAGRRLSTVLGSMVMSNPKLNAAAKAKMADGLAKDMIQGAEEALADMDVAEIQALKGWPKLVAAVRDWLRGVAQRLRAKGHTTLADAIDPKEWTDAGVAAFAVRAEAVSKGGRAKFGTDGTVFGREASPNRAVDDIMSVQRMDTPLPDGRQWVAITSENQSERYTFHRTDDEARGASESRSGQTV